MATTVARARANGNAGGPASGPKTHRWGATGKVDPVAAAVARRLKIAIRTAEHLLREAPDILIAFLEEFDAQGAEQRRHRWTRRVLAAIQGRTAPPLCDATFMLASKADAAEEPAETAFNRDDSDTNLDWLIRASEDEQRYGEARLLALYAERDRRRRERV